MINLLIWTFISFLVQNVFSWRLRSIKDGNCNQTGPYGALPRQAFPISSCIAPLWCSQITVFDACFLGCFTDVKTPHQMEDINYLMTMSTQPQASWSLRTDTVNSCDTTLCPHYRPTKELCRDWSHTRQPPSLPWLLKMFCQSPSGRTGFLRHEPPLLLSLPWNKPFSASNVSLFLASLCVGHTNLH